MVIEPGNSTWAVGNVQGPKEKKLMDYWGISNASQLPPKAYCRIPLSENDGMVAINPGSMLPPNYHPGHCSVVVIKDWHCEDLNQGLNKQTQISRLVEVVQRVQPIYVVLDYSPSRYSKLMQMMDLNLRLYGKAQIIRANRDDVLLVKKKGDDTFSLAPLPAG
jgi:hypothetical protein